MWTSTSSKLYCFCAEVASTVFLKCKSVVFCPALIVLLPQLQGNSEYPMESLGPPPIWVSYLPFFPLLLHTNISIPFLFCSLSFFSRIYIDTCIHFSELLFCSVVRNPDIILHITSPAPSSPFLQPWSLAYRVSHAWFLSITFVISIPQE